MFKKDLPSPPYENNKQTDSYVKVFKYHYFKAIDIDFNFSQKHNLYKNSVIKIQTQDRINVYLIQVYSGFMEPKVSRRTYTLIESALETRRDSISQKYSGKINTFQETMELLFYLSDILNARFYEDYKKTGNCSILCGIRRSFLSD